MLKNAGPVQQIQRIPIAQGFFDVSISHCALQDFSD